MVCFSFYKDVDQLVSLVNVRLTSPPLTEQYTADSLNYSMTFRTVSHLMDEIVSNGARSSLTLKIVFIKGISVAFVHHFLILKGTTPIND